MMNNDFSGDGVLPERSDGVKVGNVHKGKVAGCLKFVLFYNTGLNVTGQMCMAGPVKIQEAVSWLQETASSHSALI